MPYILTNAAKAGVIRIYAEAYYADMARVFGLLGDIPEMGRLRSELTPPMRIHPHGMHVVI